MDGSNVKKLSVSGLLCALAVVGSMFSFPVLGSKCAPVQHMINVLCAVILGYGVAVAFGASLIRNLLGIGSPMAFPEVWSVHFFVELYTIKVKKYFLHF